MKTTANTATELKDLFFAFKISPTSIFEVSYYRLGSNEHKHFSTSAAIFNRPKTDYIQCGQSQETVLKGHGAAMAFYKTFNPLHLESLTPAQHEAILRGIETLKTKYIYLESDRDINFSSLREMSMKKTQNPTEPNPRSKEAKEQKQREMISAQVEQFKNKCKSMKFKKGKNIYSLLFKWTVSRGRDSYGYNICTLFVDGQKVASCNGGGYDMQGACLGTWIANTFPERLYKLVKKEMYGLTFHDPLYKYEPKEDGNGVGLARYQAFYKASSKTPTKNHVYARLDGACGMSCMQDSGKVIGLSFQWLSQSDKFKNATFYTVYDSLTA